MLSRRAHPRYRGNVYYETLPPGLLIKQMEAGGRVTSGNMTWTAKPDVFMAELLGQQRLGASKASSRRRSWLSRPMTSRSWCRRATRRTWRGSPISAAPASRSRCPIPQFEGVARQIRASLVKAGGEALAEAVYGAKVRNGETILTRIHHRQTPLFLMQRLAEAGVTWRSEAIFQEKIGNPIGHVDIPAEHNTLAVYSAAMVPDAPHPEAARAWLEFIRSDAAFKVFEPYGFRRYEAKPQ